MFVISTSQFQHLLKKFNGSSASAPSPRSVLRHLLSTLRPSHYYLFQYCMATSTKRSMLTHVAVPMCAGGLQAGATAAAHSPTARCSRPRVDLWLPKRDSRRSAAKQLPAATPALVVPLPPWSTDIGPVCLGWVEQRVLGARRGWD